MPAETPTGYAHCICRDCFEIAMGGRCSDCEEANCEPGKECAAPDAYGGVPTCGILNCDADADGIEDGTPLCLDHWHDACPEDSSAGDPL